MLNIVPSPHRWEPLRRQEQPSLGQLEPVWCLCAALGRACWGCGALVFAGPCNTSHLQLITSVFVSNRMETRLKINVNHTMYRVRCGTAQGMRWRWTGAPVHSKVKCCLALGGFSHLAGHSSQPVVRYPLFLLSSLVTPVVIVQEEKWQSQLEAPMSQRCTPSSAWILSLMPFLFKSRVLGSSRFAAGLRGAALGLSVPFAKSGWVVAMAPLSSGLVPHNISFLVLSEMTPPPHSPSAHIPNF